MPRIVMEVKILDDNHSQLQRQTTSIATGLTETACKEIEREMHDHFNQVVAENPDARAAADALAHQPPPINSIRINQSFGSLDA